jgi:hypothetical protein
VAPKLSYDQVIEIRRRNEAGESQRVLSNIYGVSRSCISKSLTRELIPSQICPYCDEEYRPTQKDQDGCSKPQCIKARNKYQPQVKPTKKLIECLRCERTFTTRLDRDGLPLRHFCCTCREINNELAFGAMA